MFNLTRYEFVVSPDGFYGVPLDNGSWTGMIGMVLRGVSNRVHQQHIIYKITLHLLCNQGELLTPVCEFQEVRGNNLVIISGPKPF